MKVGHTKLRPDEVFGHICQHVGSREDALSMSDLKQQIDNHSTSNTGTVVPVAEMKDCKNLSKLSNLTVSSSTNWLMIFIFM